MVTGFMSQATNDTGSTGTSDTRRSRRGADGAEEGRPENRAARLMTANDDTPRIGESVSDASDSSRDVDDLLSHEVIKCRQLLRETVRPEADLRDVEVRVKEARARLEYLERRVEKVNQ